MKKGVIVSIVLGSVVALGLLLWLLIFLFAPNTVVLTPDKIAVVVPIVDVVPDVPEVLFIGVSTVPLDFATTQSIITNIIITFDEAMDPMTVNDNTFFIRGPNNKIITGIITSDSTKKIWTFNPTANLEFNTLYNMVITTGAKGVSGNALVRNFLWSFTTSSYAASGGSSGGSSSSTTTPEVTPVVTPVLTKITLTPTTKILNNGTTQQLNATGLDQFNSNIVATISYASNNTSIATVNASGFVTAVGTGLARITASSGAVNNTTVVSVVSAGAICPAVSVDLGTSANYAILAKSGISTTGVTSVIGDLAASPIDSTAITGFGLLLDATECFSTSSLVTGRVYAADYSTLGCTTPATLTTAVSDMETAFTTAAGLADCVTELGAGDIGGMTLAAGTYKWSTGLNIPTDVTLYGSATDVWVFEIAGGLTVASAKQIKLAGGALAKNVYWVVGDVTSIGTTSVFNGNILSAAGVPVDEAIALNTGAVLNGRALSQKAVTLDANTVTKPV